MKDLDLYPVFPKTVNSEASVLGFTLEFGVALHRWLNTLAIRVICQQCTVYFWVVVSNIFYFHLYLGKISNLTSIFSDGLVQPPTRFTFMYLHSVDLYATHGVGYSRWGRVVVGEVFLQGMVVGTLQPLKLMILMVEGNC